jgi:ATP-dependent Lon protease
MLVRRQAKRTVAMTGVLDLQGNVLPVTGLQGKLRGCQVLDFIDTLLVPEASLARLSIDSLPADLRDYARRVLRGVRTMTDVIQLAIEGE